MLLRVCGGGIPQDHYTLRARRKDAKKNVRSRHAECGVGEAWQGLQWALRCHLQRRGRNHCKMNSPGMDLAGGRRDGVESRCAPTTSLVCLPAIMARPSHPLTYQLPTLDTLLSLELTCSTHAVELLHTRPWPGSCCSACHTLDTAACWPAGRWAICRREGRRRWAAVVAS